VLWAQFLSEVPSRCGCGLQFRTVRLVDELAGQPQFIKKLMIVMKNLFVLRRYAYNYSKGLLSESINMLPEKIDKIEVEKLWYYQHL
jgi:hypothetical protein